MSKPHFIITIDTEGDNLWAHPETITTDNSRYLTRFQDLAEKYNFYPTYLTNFEMAGCKNFQTLGRRILTEKTGEIGMHLHAWNSPPIEPLTTNDYQYAPYLIEYGEDLIYRKIKKMTEVLEDTFSTSITSHRSGRWALNEIYVRILQDLNYLVDCSVTPHTSWHEHPGDPTQKGGSNYYNFPEYTYFLDIRNISKPSSSGKMIEVPMSIHYLDSSVIRKARLKLKDGSFIARVCNRLLSSPAWLRPNGNNINEMILLADKALEDKRDYVEFMLHSSEFMPGGSPNFVDESSIEKLYSDLEMLFRHMRNNFQGATLTQYYHHFTDRNNE